MKNLIQNFLRWLLHFFENDADSKDKTVTTISKEPGLACPKCQNKIKISIPMLLTGQPIVCPNCLLELRIDTEKSLESLKALKKLQNDFEKAERIKNQV